VKHGRLPASPVPIGHEKYPGMRATYSLAGKKNRRACRFRPGPFDETHEGRSGAARKRLRPASEEGETAMRFMVMVKASRDSEAGKLPSEEALAKMGRFNEEMVKAGVMLDGNGLQASSKGARIRFTGGGLCDTSGTRTVIDGPFAETKELVAGYWLIQVRDLAEAIAWMKRCPKPHEEDCEIEIRQLFELEDFGDNAAVEQHRKLGAEIAKGRER
jgi:hypothetical protein